MLGLLFQSGLWLAHRFSTQVAFWGGWAGFITVLPEPYPLPAAFALSLLVSFATFAAVRRRFGPPAPTFPALFVWAFYEGLLLAVRFVLGGFLMSLFLVGPSSLRATAAAPSLLLAVGFATVAMVSWWVFRHVVWMSPSSSASER